MTIGNVAPQETPESEEKKPMKVVHFADECPVCKFGMVSRFYHEGEVGFRDNCNSCEFEGVNITAMVRPDGSLTWDY